MKMKTRNTMISGVVLITAIALFQPTLSYADARNPNTDWFKESRYGVFMHLLASNAESLALVDVFDANALAGQLESVGAKYFVLTLGQNSGFMNSPNPTYNRYTGYEPGQRCSKRDLPMDIYKALRPKGIRLMLYLPCQVPNGDARAQKAFGLPQGAKDQPIDVAFAQKWAEVIYDWSSRYKEKVAGWWFDGGYQHIHFNEQIAQIYADAVKRGNPKAIVTFNPGVKLIRWTKAEDYTAGELNEPFGTVPTDRWLNGSQWHALTYLGSHWSGRDTRYPAEKWANWVRAAVVAGGVVTIDAGPNWNPGNGPIGAISDEQIGQLRAIRDALPPPEKKSGLQKPRSADKKVKVFILAGQSNMEGHGQVRSLDWLGRHPKYGHLLKKLKNADGSWAVRDDVTISYQAEHRKKKTGPLTVGWGSEEHEIGPELMFGTIMGERCEEHVLLIKTAWGGKSVWCDFRSPGAGEMTWDEKRILKRDNHLKPGLFYDKMLAEIKECLANITDVVPGYKGQGYEIVGMAWFQGWNDFCEWHLQLDGKRVGMGLIERYPHNLKAMFRDLRKDLNVPEMPIVIGELGVGGHEMTTRAQNPDDHEAVAMAKFRNAQKAVADDPSLKNITFVPTVDFWDTRLQELRRQADVYWNEKQKRKIKDTDDNVLPTKELNDEYWRLGGHWYCHYNGSASNYSLIGYALAKALNTASSLAMTSPMGWKSWIAFETEIDEKKSRRLHPQ